MHHPLLACVGLSALGGLQGVATLAIDFNRTHATNPLWPRHARFHLVWQSLAVALQALVVLWLLWHAGLPGPRDFYLGCVLTALSPLGFMGALASRGLYNGALLDPNGIPPARLRVAGHPMSLDMNLAAVVVALIALLVLLWLY